jgi:transcriptional regulator with XRE-family HTH domain
MRKNERLRTLDAVIGGNLRRLRKGAGLTQDQLSRHLRQRGLSWTRPTVAAVELGTKTLDVGELWLLGLALVSLGNPSPFGELLAGDGRVRVGGGEESTPTLDFFRSFLTNDFEALRSATLRDAGTPHFHEELRAAVERKVVAPFRRVGELAPDLKVADMRTVEEAARGDAERAAARRLRVDPVTLSAAAFGRWGRSLTDERDARVTATDSQGSPAHATRGRRGHVTRQLLEELEPILRRKT